MPVNPTVHVFLHDPAFIERDNPSKPIFSVVGGLCIPAAKHLSYFKTLYQIVDARTERDPLPSAALAATKPIILLDQDEYAGFIGQYTAMSSSFKGMLFAIIDRVLLGNRSTDTATTLDTELTNDPRYGIYKPFSLSVAPSRSVGTAYLGGGDTEVIVAPDWALFKISVATPSGPQDVEIKVWASDGAFGVGYPVSIITEVIPPLDYTTLFSAPLIGAGSNPFTIAMNSATLGQGKLDPKLRDDDSSGLHLQKIAFYDANGNVMLVPFSILYKGARPGVLAIRRAIRQEVLTSGVGDPTRWRQRAPELFVEDQFYCIPQWNIRTERPDQVVYPNISPLPILIQNTRDALPQYATDYISQSTEVISAAYDTLTLTSVPNPINVAEFSILTLHPTYQNFAANEQGFNWMAQNTKEFAIKLNRALAVAAGKAVDPLYEPRYEGTLIYIPFVVGFVEYYVMTKESFLNAVG